MKHIKNIKVLLLLAVLLLYPFLILHIIVNMYMSYMCVNISVIFLTIIIHTDFVIYMIYKKSKN